MIEGAARIQEKGERGRERDELFTVMYSSVIIDITVMSFSYILALTILFYNFSTNKAH